MSVAIARGGDTKSDTLRLVRSETLFFVFLFCLTLVINKWKPESFA